MVLFEYVQLKKNFQHHIFLQDRVFSPLAIQYNACGERLSVWTASLAGGFRCDLNLLSNMNKLLRFNCSCYQLVCPSGSVNVEKFFQSKILFIFINVTNLEKAPHLQLGSSDFILSLEKRGKNSSGKDTANIITNKYNTAGGSEPFPGLQWYLSCFSVLIISTAARSAVNNIFSAGVHQALNLYFTPHIKKTQAFPLC